MSAIRILHNVDAKALVDVRIDNKIIAGNLAYQDLTVYLSVSYGEHKIVVTVAGTETVLAKSKFRIEQCDKLTIMIAGLISGNPNISIFIYEDILKCPAPGNSHLRFIHGAAGAPAVDVYVKNVKAFSNVKYSETGTPSYAPIKVGVSNGGNPYLVPLTVKIAGTNTIVAGPLDAYLISGGIYTVFASGLVNDLPLAALLFNDNPNKCEELQSNFQAQKYMGRWFQIADIPQFYEANCPRPVADYTLLTTGVNVHNSCYDENWDLTRSITGLAVAPDPCVPAALNVSFPNSPNPISGPNYLIHKTDYTDFSVVGSPTRTSLYILSRTSKMCVKKYQELVKYAESLGYNTDLLVLNYDTIDNKGEKKYSKCNCRK